MYNQHVPSLGHPVQVNLINENQLSRAMIEIRPEVIVHAAAMTDVDLCEREKELALSVNYEATRALSRIARELNSFFVYVSTDYVFDGRRGMYSESDEQNPINSYGISKLKGEQAVKDQLSDYVIARASVIYGPTPSSGKVNFALWLVDKLRKSEHTRVLKDQYVSPTLNTSLAEMILESVERRLTGVFHFAGASRVNRYEFARTLADVFGFDASLTEPASIKDMKWLAERPRDSSLDVSKANSTLKAKPLPLVDSLMKLKQLTSVGGSE